MDERPTAMRNRVAVLAAVLAFALLVGGVAVLAGRGDGAGGLPKLTYGNIGSTGGGRDERTMAAADMALYPYKAEFRMPKPLAKPAETAPAYRLRVGEDDVARLASAFGLGKPKRTDDGWIATGGPGQLTVQKSGTWWFGPEDKIEPDTAVSSGGSSGATSETVAPKPPERDLSVPNMPGVTECAPCPPDVICTMDCRPMQRAEGLPANEEAEQIARDFWRRAGIDVGAAKVEVYDNYLSIFVHFTPMVDGRPITGLHHSVTVGPHKAVPTASGFILDLDKLGDYPLVDPAVAVDRLNNPPAFYAEGDPPTAITMAPMPRDAVGVSAGATGSGVDPGAPPTQVAPVPPTDSKPPVDGAEPMPIPVPPEPRPEPAPVPTEPQIQNLTAIRLGYQLAGDAILPVYIFTVEAGGDAGPVPAVADSLLHKSRQ